MVGDCRRCLGHRLSPRLREWRRRIASKTKKTPRRLGNASRGDLVPFVVMRAQNLLFVCCSALAFAGGCNQAGTTAPQLEEVQATTQAIKDFSYPQKAQFLKRLEGRLIALDRDLDELAARIEKSSDAAKAEAKPKLQALRGQAALLSLALDRARSATELTWAGLRDGCQQTYASSEEEFQQTRQWASANIAP